MWLMRIALAFVFSVFVASVLASAAHTHFVLDALRAVGTEISLAEQVDATIADFIGFASQGALPLSFQVVVAGSLFIAFVVAGIISWMAPGLRLIAFVAAGFAAMIAALIIMQIALGVMPVAGARGLMGHIAQGGAGAVGGWLFAMLSRKPDSS